MSSVRADDPASVARSYDLVVLGAGSGGLGAALAGARQGLSVLLLEKSDEIGGTAVRSGVSMWEPGVGGTGVPFEIYERLRAAPGAVGVYSFGRHCSWDGAKSFPGGEHVIDPDRKYADTLRRHGGYSEAFKREHLHGVIFEPPAYARVLREMLAETGRCTLLTQTTFRSVQTEGKRVSRLVLTDGAHVTANAFIDATGDGVLCEACGCEMMLGQESREKFGEPSAPEQPNQRVNGVTLIFRITPVAEPRIEPLPDNVPRECWWQKRFPSISAVQYPNGDYNCNMLPTMTGLQFLELRRGRGYQAAHDECRRRVLAQWHYIQTNYPEFQGYRIAWVAPALGIRETHRVVGEYVLTEHDLMAGLSGQSHPDIITIADHPMDRHGGGRSGRELEGPYGVPYRCLVVKGFENLLVACRGASFSSLAASSCRLARTMMQLGQAAGTAAALAKQGSWPLPGIPAEKLRAALRAQYCQLDWPMPPTLKAYVETE